MLSGREIGAERLDALAIVIVWFRRAGSLFPALSSRVRRVERKAGLCSSIMGPAVEAPPPPPRPPVVLHVLSKGLLSSRCNGFAALPVWKSGVLSFSFLILSCESRWFLWFCGFCFVFCLFCCFYNVGWLVGFV